MVARPPTRSASALRREMVVIGRRLYERGLIVAAEGNISVRLPNGRTLVTPAGFCKGRMTTRDLVVVDADGRTVSGPWPPSSEVRMHLAALAARTDVNACVHAHPPYATAFAVAGIALTEPVLPEVIVTLRSIPLAEYATPGTGAVGVSIERHIAGADAILLKNHGVLTLGVDLETAFRRMEIVERCAQVICLARGLGHVDHLSPSQVGELFRPNR
ncbi:MAG: class II aldolase/adducin family protein [Candidatus Zixiibacteriota bacterium]